MTSTPEPANDDPKRNLQAYLQAARDALLWKVEGVAERDLRLPRTPTGTNLIGIIKHCANVEAGTSARRSVGRIRTLASWSPENASRPIRRPTGTPPSRRAPAS